MQSFNVWAWKFGVSAFKKKIKMQKEENYYMWFFLFTIYSKSTLDNTIGP
jgi:hypothetical protein